MAMNWPRSFRGRPPSISQTGSTCWPWATRSTRPALLTSLTNANEPCAGCLPHSLCDFEIVIKDLCRGSKRCREILSMAQFQTRPARALDKVDPVWARIRIEAEDIARREPDLATFIYENILHHDSLEAAIAHRVSQRLAHADVSADMIRQA